MKHLGRSPGLTLAALLLLCVSVGRPVAAQTPPQDMVAFRATFKGRTAPGAPQALPLTPPSVPVTLSFIGETTPLGQVAYITHEIHRFDTLGTPRSITDGIGVFTAANGDALFINHSGLIRATHTPGVFTFEEARSAFGGKGKFPGCHGGGLLRATVDVRDIATQGAEWTLTFEGMISAPRP